VAPAGRSRSRQQEREGLDVAHRRTIAELAGCLRFDFLAGFSRIVEG
jgi:hypothetical protein